LRRTDIGIVSYKGIETGLKLIHGVHSKLISEKKVVMDRLNIAMLSMQ